MVNLHGFEEINPRLSFSRWILYGQFHQFRVLPRAFRGYCNTVYGKVFLFLIYGTFRYYSKNVAAYTLFPQQQHFKVCSWCWFMWVYFVNASYKNHLFLCGQPTQGTNCIILLENIFHQRSLTQRFRDLIRPMDINYMSSINIRLLAANLNSIKSRRKKKT